jgi:uncharacterized protein YukE
LLCQNEVRGAFAPSKTPALRQPGEPPCSSLRLPIALEQGRISRVETLNSIENIVMAQAIMDPEQVRRFADELKRFNADLQDKIASLQARFAALGDTWQDQEHAKFAEEFKQIVKALKKFVEVSNQQTPYLLRKAQRIEEYLSQR